MCRCYYDGLERRLQQQHGMDACTYSFDLLSHHYQLAYLDYARFLVGAMWGGVTPQSCMSLDGDINQGMHKRSAVHLVHMVEKADMLLSQLEHSMQTKEGTLLGFSHVDLSETT